MKTLGHMQIFFTVLIALFLAGCDSSAPKQTTTTGVATAGEATTTAASPETTTAPVEHTVHNASQTAVTTAPAYSTPAARPRPKRVIDQGGTKAIGLRTQKPGFVISPYAMYDEPIDVTGLPSGTEVKCPYTGKIFIVP